MSLHLGETLKPTMHRANVIQNKNTEAIACPLTHLNNGFGSAVLGISDISGEPQIHSILSLTHPPYTVTPPPNFPLPHRRLAANVFNGLQLCHIAQSYASCHLRGISVITQDFCSLVSWCGEHYSHVFIIFY